MLPALKLLVRPVGSVFRHFKQLPKVQHFVKNKIVRAFEIAHLLNLYNIIIAPYYTRKQLHSFLLAVIM